MPILIFLLALPTLLFGGIESIPQFENLPNGYDNCCMETNGELFVISLIEEGNTVIDVGANVGGWSQHALDRCENIQLYAFEPLPTLFPALSELLEGRADSFNLALSDKVGTFTFYHYEKYPALSSFHRRSRKIENQIGCKPKKIPVPATTLDLFCAEKGITHIHLLKIDTEGHELAVLRGAKRLVESRSIDFIQFEYGGCYSDAGTHLKDVYKLLDHSGYEIYRVFEGGLIRIRRWDPSLENYCYSNYLAVSKR